MKLTGIFRVTTERQTLTDGHGVGSSGLLGESSARDLLHAGGGSPTGRESDSLGGEVRVETGTVRLGGSVKRKGS